MNRSYQPRLNPGVAPPRYRGPNWHLRIAGGFLLLSLVLFALAITQRNEGSRPDEGGSSTGRTANVAPEQIGSFQSLATELRVLDNGNFLITETCRFKNLQETGISGIARIYTNQGPLGEARALSLLAATRATVSAGEQRQPEQPIAFRMRSGYPAANYVTFELGDPQQPLGPGVYQFYTQYEVQPGLQFSAGEAVAQWNVTGVQRRLLVEQASAVVILPRGITPTQAAARAAVVPAEWNEEGFPHFRFDNPEARLLRFDLRAAPGGDRLTELVVRSPEILRQHQALIVEARWREQTVKAGQ